jgi:tRNA(adenine34) deaminase
MRSLFALVAIMLLLHAVESFEKLLPQTRNLMSRVRRISSSKYASFGSYAGLTTCAFAAASNESPIPRDKDEHYMRLALRHAQHSFREKEVPIGAVIVDVNGEILATSRNRVETKKDVTAHAEIDCLRKAAELKGNWRLSGCTLYSTLEPCPMCMGAIQASRISRVVYAAPDIRVGACGSWVDLVSSKHPYHEVEIRGDLLKEESSVMLRRFFQMRRREKLQSDSTFEKEEGSGQIVQEAFVDRGVFMKALLDEEERDASPA